jgi:hypothetical protein
MAIHKRQVVHVQQRLLHLRMRISKKKKKKKKKNLPTN